MPRETEMERLYDQHAQPLFAFLLNFTHNEADTRELQLLAGVRAEENVALELFKTEQRDSGLQFGIHDNGQRATPTGEWLAR
jgi:hypothetical protein